MPPFLVSLLLMLGKPAFIFFLRLLEKKFPGIADLFEAIIRYLEGADSKEDALKVLTKQCEGVIGCTTELK